MEEPPAESELRELLRGYQSSLRETRRKKQQDHADATGLIDSDHLCDRLKEYELGVRRTVEQVEAVELRPEFFEEL